MPALPPALQDVESGFASDRGLGGQPAPDYCILACEQWNSPLYCDRNHPQESHCGEQGVGVCRMWNRGLVGVACTVAGMHY